MQLIFGDEFIFYTSSMYEICLNCHWLGLSSFILNFGQCEKSIRNIYCGLFRNVFNWTWSYKNNSDIYHPYGYGFFPKAEKPPSHHWKQRNLEVYDMNR